MFVLVSGHGQRTGHKALFNDVLRGIDSALTKLAAETPAMYSITYVLFIGTALHRARSASAALEAIAMLRAGGATVIKIVVTSTGREITERQLAGLAERES